MKIDTISHAESSDFVFTVMGERERLFIHEATRDANASKSIDDSLEHFLQSRWTHMNSADAARPSFPDPEVMSTGSTYGVYPIEILCQKRGVIAMTCCHEGGGNPERMIRYESLSM